MSAIKRKDQSMRAVTSTVETRNTAKDFLAMAYGYRAIGRQEGISNKQRAVAYFNARRCIKAIREILS